MTNERKIKLYIRFHIYQTATVQNSISNPHHLPQSILLFFAPKDDVDGISRKFTDLFSVQLEMLCNECVLIRKAASEDANIIGLHNHQNKSTSIETRFHQMM